MDDEQSNVQVESTEVSERERRIQAKAKLLGECMTFEQAIRSLAEYIIFSQEVKATFARLQMSAAEEMRKSDALIDEFCDQSKRVIDIAETYIDLGMVFKTHRRNGFDRLNPA